MKIEQKAIPNERKPRIIHITLKELIFAGTKFRSFWGHPRKLIPAKFYLESHPRNLIPTKLSSIKVEFFN